MHSGQGTHKGTSGRKGLSQPRGQPVGMENRELGEANLRKKVGDSAPIQAIVPRFKASVCGN